MASPFGFLRAEWPAVFEAAEKAVASAHPDPRAACFYARRALELAVAWAYRSDASLRLPYQDNLSALIHEPSFKKAAGEAIFSKARVITQLGNQAVHSHRPIQPFDAVAAVRELFHVGYWLARTYARGARPAPGLTFDADSLPRTTPLPRQTVEQLQALQASLHERDEKLSALLADRSAPDAAPVNLVTERDGEGRVFVSTYPTMMGLIDETRDGQRRFGVGHFDLVVIDEAHRSVYQKYRAIFEYFDALLVGLTATPKDEIDVNTYGLFDLERGVPTDAYPLADAVRDGFLVPPKAVSVPLKFHREGITYDQLADDEKEQWDALEWSEDGSTPDRVEAAAVNQWLFNRDTVDKVLEHLMTRGQTVAGGDRLGKTIVFAKNQAHAEFIAQRFDANYPHFRGAFARVIHSGMPYAQSLIDDFSTPTKPPHIAISVDMLDTGIDIPEVVNLVFIKLVRSKTKFWQMVGRGTRLCKDLFGPGKDKEFFYILDYCENLEFFSQSPDTTEGALAESLGKRLFKARLELLGELDRPRDDGVAGAVGTAAERLAAYGPAETAALRAEVADLLHGEVAAMNLDNFVVRPRRRLVERYAKAEAWAALSPDSLAEMARELAGLPSEQEPEDEEAKRFDLLILHLQLAVLRAEPSFERLSVQVRAIAGLLEEKASIPMVRQQLPLIQDIQADEWWQDVTPSMLEGARKRLRALVKLIDKQKRRPIYTDFEDRMGRESPVDLPGFTLPGELRAAAVAAWPHDSSRDGNAVSCPPWTSPAPSRRCRTRRSTSAWPIISGTGGPGCSTRRRCSSTCG